MTTNGQDEKDNLLVVLHKWASSQDENFTTEAFAHLLKDWIHSEPKAALIILRNFYPKLTDADCPELKVISQQRIDGCQPDIRVQSRDGRQVKIIIEVKVKQDVDWEQIKKYSDELGDTRFRQTCLALLTRDLIEKEEHEHAALVDSYVLWYQVAECIREELSNDHVKNPISKHLAEQFLEFLKRRGMTMEKVSTHLIEGVRSLSSLMNMLEEAVLLGLSDRTKGHWKSEKIRWEDGSIGLYFGPLGTIGGDWRYYWCGLLPESGGVVVFQAYYVESRALGDIDGWRRKTEGKCDVWYHGLDLSSENFFNLPVEDQKERIKRFVEDNLLLVETKRALPKLGA